MNDSDIDEMEVGHKLDALVAEKVMGWKWYHARAFAGNWVNRLIPDDAPAEYLPGKIDTGHQAPFYGPNYSHDIKAAWEVVEKMEEGEWQFQASNTIPNSDPIIYEWEFTNVGKRGDALEFSMPMAICKAALKAVLAGEKTGD